MVPEVRLPSLEEVEVAADATGLKAGLAGEYRYEMCGGSRTGRKSVKMVVIVDARSGKLLSVEAGVQGKGRLEPEVAAEEVRRLRGQGVKVLRFYGSSAFDSEELFEALSDVGAEAAVRIRANARDDFPSRLRIALGYKE